MIFLKEFSKKIDFEKKSADNIEKSIFKTLAC